MTDQTQRPTESATEGYGTREVAEFLGLPAARVRGFARSGLVSTRRDDRGRYRFSFQDMVLIRTAASLESDELSPRKIRRVLRRLRAQLGPARPLSAVQLFAEGGSLVAREGAAMWDAESGQLLLDIDRPGPEASTSASDPENAVALSAAASERSLASGASALTAEEWYDAACELERSSPEEARQAYGRALELRPDHPEAHVNLGRLLHEHGELRAAEAHYRAALAARPGSPTPAFNLGVVLEDLGEPQRAIEAYLRAVSADPETADAHYNLARLYEAAGDRSAALRHLRSYSELTKTS